MSLDHLREPLEKEWRGVKQFACRLCPFESEVEAVFRDHLHGAHPLPEGGEPTPAATDAPIVAAAPEPEPAAAEEPAAEPDAPAAEPAAATPEPEPVATPAPDLPLAPEPDPTPEPAPEPAAASDPSTEPGWTGKDA